MVPSQGLGSKASGISTIISSIRRDAVDATSHEAKSLNYLNNILARWEAIDAGASEAIMLDSRGFVSEATADSIFIVGDSNIFAPSKNSSILSGITRLKVIEIVRKLGHILIKTSRHFNSRLQMKSF
jgi:branched-chain amino acid aminotransferase